MLRSTKSTHGEFSDEKKVDFETDLYFVFYGYHQKYMDAMGGYYTNGNVGLTKNGKENNFSSNFDRKCTVVRADVEKMMDYALSSERFNDIDECPTIIHPLKSVKEGSMQGHYELHEHE